MGEREAMCEWEGSRVRDRSENIVEEASEREGSHEACSAGMNAKTNSCTVDVQTTQV